MKEYIRTRHSVYLLTYHMVFVTKWRKPVITDEIGDFMVSTAKRLCDGYGGELISGETDRDHIHLLVSLPPSKNITDIVRSLKTQLSKEVHAGIRPDSKKTDLRKCPAVVSFVFCSNDWLCFHGCCEAIYRGTTHR